MEMMTVLLIFGTLLALAVSTLSRMKSRVTLATTVAELQGLIHQARQSALASGNPVAILIYPNYSASATGAQSTGYVVAYQDACFDFFTTTPACGMNYGNFNPAAPVVGANGAVQSTVLDTMPLPNGIIVGPATGMGAGATLVAPLQSILVNTYCSFCGPTGGAIQFDPRGQATFYSLNGTNFTPVPVTGGGSLSLTYDPLTTSVTGQRTLIIFSASGAVQTINRG
jgi:Tfp pilus assembly protein FimT